jgi:hypothetical protein
MLLAARSRVFPRRRNRLRAKRSNERSIDWVFLRPTLRSAAEFAEVALSRGARLELYIPFDESTFLARSVDFAGAGWRARFLAAKTRATLHVMPQERGPTPEGDDPYTRNNLWMLQAAGRFGATRVEFVCLWDGQGGDGPGGTEQLMKEVRRREGHSHWLHTKQLWSEVT